MVEIVDPMNELESVDMNLKDYTAPKLDAEAEVCTLSALVDQLRADPSFSISEAACQASRRVRIAVEQEAWEFHHNPTSQQHRRRALELLSAIADLEDATLRVVSPADSPIVSRFFFNMARRRQYLNESAN